jgi:hypothetical protein
MATIRSPRWRRQQVETLVERCAGLDVHKDSVTACLTAPVKATASAV